ncbi:beta strand repeat-containing protein [Methanoregula sp.]|uniref:beta strand repeat-containing protein n=1 Tax=Methanoregula sp. TaxID=2052170 RepID=UPI003C71EC3C
MEYVGQKRYSLVLVLVLIIAVVVIAAPVSATTWTIHPGTGVINATINNGSVLSGDTIILSPGTYFENNINVSTNINILSSGSQANTFIDGNQSEGGLFIVTGSYALSITGVTMRNANASTLDGGAIDSLIGGTVTVSSSTITNCSAISGGAIAAQGNIVITSSTITDCSARLIGGALATMGNVAVTSSTITNCVASGGGAIGSVGGGTVTVSSSTITNCSATSGGAIYNLEGTLAVESSSTISDCTAAVFGGAIATEEGTDAITSSTISDCTAGAGGAIYSEDGSVTLEGSSTVTGCSAINGGAIATEEGTDTITSSTISDCTATEFGGAIVTELGSVTITSSKIAGSSATEAGGAIGLIGNATISSSTITGCSAGLIGGAIWFEGGETPGLSPDIAMSLPLTTSLTSAVGPKGSGPFSFTLPSVSPPSVDDFGPTNLTLTTTTISGCSAGYGGGLYSEGGNVTITSSTITGSTASETGGGGAINTSILQSGTMQFSQIYNNSVPEVTNGAIVPIAPGFTIPTLTATDNFWGTNSPSSGIVGGNVQLNPWLVLGISAAPTSFVAGGSSAVQANLIYDSNGDNTYSPGNAVADGTPVSFAVISGQGSFNPSQGSTTSGVSQTAFTSFTSGTSVVQATVDGFPVSVPITVTGKARSTGTCYWCSGNGASGSGAGYTGSSASSSGYTGPSPTQSGGSPTQMPTVKPAVVTPTIVTPVATAPVTTVATMASLPTNTPKTGLDMVPTLGALGLCGAIFLFQKNRN